MRSIIYIDPVADDIDLKTKLRGSWYIVMERIKHPLPVSIPYDFYKINILLKPESSVVIPAWFKKLTLNKCASELVMIFVWVIWGTKYAKSALRASSWNNCSACTAWWGDDLLFAIQLLIKKSKGRKITGHWWCCWLLVEGMGYGWRQWRLGSLSWKWVPGDRQR